MIFIDMDLISTYFYHPSPRKRQKSIAYLQAYERHLSKFKNRSPFLLNIGCGYPSQGQNDPGMGGCLQVFSSWLGIGTRIVGIDILEGCKEYEDADNGIRIEIGSQDDEYFLNEIIKKYGEPDIIIDDGSHLDAHINKSFDCLFKHLKTGGIYSIEDIGGNHLVSDSENPPKPFDSKERYIQKSFDNVLLMNQFYTRGMKAKKRGVVQPMVRASSLGSMINSISYYPNLVIYEKGANTPYDQPISPPSTHTVW